MSGRRVLVIAAHPDDAELAVGGTIAMLARSGAHVRIANFTVSERTESARGRRMEAARRAAALLGAELTWAFAGEFDQVEDVPEYRCVAEVDRIVEDMGPDYVLTHHSIDSHGDHVRLARAVLASSRRWNAQLFAFGPNEYRTPAYQEFTASVFVDTSDHIAAKLAAIDFYNYPEAAFARLELDKIEALDRARGVACGFAAAEGLTAIRMLGFPMDFTGAARE